ncbi:hypothetical protein CTAYLR_010446 [Chrysophaeum taylorii]|uniref:Bacterial surface antigen (D15) domain-containing protein n=1 Tax=Chrysophaeum taylorii TaxID=2483200 RepID=A0AAD7U6T8_9STRA|nr:hypothetical protein CTAYLR_010446 [Chrysophaeum taylorii]
MSLLLSEAVLSEPLRVVSVDVTGLWRTLPYVVDDELRFVRRAETLGDIVSRLEQAVVALRSFEVFEDVQASVGRNAGGGARIAVTIKEKQVGALKIGASTSDDVSFEASGWLRGILGHAEICRVAFSRSRPSKDMLASVRRQRIGGTPVDAAIELQDGDAAAPWAPATSKVKTRACRVVATTPLDGLTLELAERSEDETSLKLSAKFAKRLDTREPRAAPLRGSLFDASVEVAGLLGASFVKLEAAFQRHVPILPAVLSFGVRGGVLFDEGAHFRPDRFYLGAPSFRGFDRAGVGPRSKASAHGGTLSYSLLAMLSLPLAPKSQDVLRGHAFLTLGGLADDPGTAIANPRATFGLGVCLAPQALLRLEINYAALVKAHPADLVTRFHFLFSADFL